MAMNIAQSSYLNWLAQEETTRQQKIRTFRSYYDGDFPTLATARQLEYLNIEGDKGIGINLCAPIVDTLVERLEVTGFTVAKKKKPGERPAPMMGRDMSMPDMPDAGAVLADILDGWWADNRMDGKQGWVHTAAARDSEGFVLVEYDADDDYPCIEHDYAYDGTSGVKVHIKPGTHHEVMCASKRWIEKDGKGNTAVRLNMYFDNRIEKWISRQPGQRQTLWEPLPIPPDDDDGMVSVVLTDDTGTPYAASVVWQTEDRTATGKPLGVPVFHFVNKDDGTGQGISELDNAIVLNDGVNKTYLDILAAADTAGFKMSWTDGVLPDNVKVYPGAMIPVVPQQGSTSAQIGEIAPGDLSQLIMALNNQIAILSGITGTPQSRFTPAAVRPSEGTQKQDESALLAKVRDRQRVWGNAWEDVMKYCLKLARAFGQMEIPDTDGLTISTTWADAETRNEVEHMNALAVKAEKLNVPVEQLWSEAGYTADQIRKFKAIRDAEKRDTLRAAARQAGAAAAQNNAPQQPPNSGSGESANAGPPANMNGGKGGNMERQPMPMEMSRF